MARERMTRRRFLARTAAAGAGLAVLGLGVQCRATPTPEVPERILFIGNLGSFQHLGVDTHLRELAASRSPALTVETGRAGDPESEWLLSEHAAGDTFALDEIRKGGWDVVVLQGWPADVADEEQLSQSCTRLDEEIKKVGGRTVLFMNWGLIGPQEGEPLGIRTQAKGWENVAAELGARVAPVGLAGERAIQKNPDLALYAVAYAYPFIHGTYLAACVFYATLFGESPVGLSYAPEGITDEERAFLQRMAWETVEEYKQPAAD